MTGKGNAMKRMLIALSVVVVLSLAALSLSLPGFSEGFIRGFSTTSGMVWLGL